MVVPRKSSEATARARQTKTKMESSIQERAVALTLPGAPWKILVSKYLSLPSTKSRPRKSRGKHKISYSTERNTQRKISGMIALESKCFPTAIISPLKITVFGVKRDGIVVKIIRSLDFALTCFILDLKN